MMESKLTSTAARTARVCTSATASFDSSSARNHVLNSAVKDFLLGLGELDEDHISEFQSNFRFEDLTEEEL